MKPILACFLLTLAQLIAAPAQPNILFIFIDDIGWGDLSCYGSPVVDKAGQPITPRLDQLASEGIRFNQGYVASPICSPSRVGVLTGMHPCRHGIMSFLASRTENNNRQMNHWLQADVATSARAFRNAGYLTGQFGKWHMGGGRDVNDAPFPQDYGFQNSLVAFEGMGDRVLYNDDGVPDGLSTQNADVPGAITWAEWEAGAGLHTDAAIQFIQNAHAAGKPFFVHVPYNDTHSPYDVEPGHENDFDHITSNDQAKRFLGELNALDQQIGRLIDTVDGLGLADETLILVIGDNGAPNDNLNTLLNRNGGLRGGKGTLWEGGIREPFLVRMPGTVPAGLVNQTTAVSTLDLFPTYCAMAGIPLPAAPLAGENILPVFQGSTQPRQRPIFWEYGTSLVNQPGSPMLAVRSGDLKFMRDPNGSDRHLFNLATDQEESTNLINDPAYAADIARLEAMLVQWHQEIVLGEVGPTYPRFSGDPAVIIADSYDLPGGNSATGGFGSDSGLNENLPSRLSGQMAGDLSYVQTALGKAASAHSIANGRLLISEAAEPTAFQLALLGNSPYNFGPRIAGRKYEWRVTMDYDDPVASEPRMTLGIADSPAPDGGVGGHDLGIQIDLVSGNTVSVFKRMDASSHSGTGDINQAIVTGLPQGEPVAVRVVIDEDPSPANTGSYEIFINGNSVNTGSMIFSNSSRYLIFDTAGGVGPATYDDFALETLDAAADVDGRIPMLSLSEVEVTAVEGVERARLVWNTQPTQAVEILISDDMSEWTPLLVNGQPLRVDTVHGTIRWQEVTLPAGYQDRAFLRLRTLD